MTPNPWYREPWPWAIMAGPAIVVVAGIITTVIAVTSFDGLVADDYYKQGLGINRVIAREAAAKQLGVSAGVAFSPDRSRVRLVLAPGTALVTPRLALAHPTLQSEDREVVLAMTSPGVYEGSMRAPRPGRYQLRVEDGAGRWRLTGAWFTGDDAVQLVP